jgi:peptide-methionine (R)-S-oxide reductase
MPQPSTQPKYDVTPLDRAEIDELAKSLSDDERAVILYSGTEPPFCGNLLANKKQGTYVCRLCALPLFESKTKFESGTGWPSFYQPVGRDHIAYIQDSSHGMTRTEIRCARCGGHLGHVFEDGPKPTGERYCLNSASLEFVEDGQPLPKKTRIDQMRK